MLCLSGEKGLGVAMLYRLVVQQEVGDIIQGSAGANWAAAMGRSMNVTA